MKKIEILLYSYEELAEDVKKTVLENLVSDLVQGTDVTAFFPLAVERAEENQTPWFLGGFILDLYKEEVEDMAKEGYYLPDGREWTLGLLNN